MEKTLVVKKETGAICQATPKEAKRLIATGNYELKDKVARKIPTPKAKED